MRLLATRMVLPCTFCFLSPDRFILPCDLHDDTHDAGRLFLGLLQAPLGAGPIVSVGRHISRIFILIFNPLPIVDHCFIVVYVTVATPIIVHIQHTCYWLSGISYML